MRNISKITNYIRQPAERITNHSSYGFTLVEILIAVFLFGVLALAIVGLITLGTRISIESERQTVAQAIVNEQIEFVRSLPYDDVGYTDAAGTEPDGVVVRSQDIARNQQQYATAVTIELRDDEDNASLPSPGDLTEANSDYKQVGVSAAWMTSSGNLRQVVATTVVAPGGNVDACTPGMTTCPGGVICPGTGVCRNANPAAACPGEAYFCGGASSSPAYLTTVSDLYVYQPVPSINPSPALIGNYGGFPGNSGMLDLARNSSTGLLYGITDYGGAPTDTAIYILDKATALPTFLTTLTTQPGDVYTAAGFLSDGRLAIGGTNKVKFVTLTGNGYGVTGTTELDLSYVGGPVQFSGDLVERGGLIWFIGNAPGLPGDYCFEANPSTGVATLVSLAPAGPPNTVWGAICEDGPCSTIRIFTGSGLTSVIDPNTCLPIVGSTYPLGQAWEGASN